MNYRRASQVAEGAVLGAVVAVHVALTVAARQFPYVTWLQIWGDAQPLAAITLMTAWIVLGPGWRLLRVIVAPLFLMIGWVVVAASIEPRFFQPAPMPWPFTFAIATALFVVGVRVFSLRMTRISCFESDARPQFSILSLLVTTTLIAVAVGGLEALRPYLLSANGGARYYDDLRIFFVDLEAKATWGRLEVTRGVVPDPATVRQFVLALAVAGSALGGLAMMLRPGVIWLRLVILAIAIPGMAAYLVHLAGEGNVLGASAGELTAGFAAVALLSAVSVLPLRLMGYRLRRVASKKRGSAVPAERELPMDVLSQHLSDGDRRTTMRRATLPQATVETIP